VIPEVEELQRNRNGAKPRVTAAQAVAAIHGPLALSLTRGFGDTPVIPAPGLKAQASFRYTL
jgi:hypothetical protein